ncbi:MAG: PilZ domain-containing protein [Myxococcota bacterium]
MSRKKNKNKPDAKPAMGATHATAGEVSDWGAKLDAPPPPPLSSSEEAEPASKKKKATAPSVMGFLSRVGGAPTLGKTPARGLLGKISADDLRAVGRLPNDGADGEGDHLPPPPAPPAEVMAAPEVVPVATEPETPVARVDVKVVEETPAAPLTTESASERLRALRHLTPPRGTIENRKSDRYPFRVTVEYTAVGRSSSELADNLSEKGLFIHTANPLEVGDPVMINFAVPDATFPLTFPARVKWVTAFGSLNNATPGMGLEFTALDDKKRRALESIISRLRRPGREEA